MALPRDDAQTTGKKAMKQIKISLALLALLVAIPGSAMAFFGLGVADDWHAAATHKALPSMHFVVPASDLPRICKTHPGAATYGCAVRIKEDNVCLIYTAKNPPQWLMDHERKHCEQNDHDGENRNDTDDPSGSVQFIAHHLCE